jgi:plastocyanin
MTPLRVFLLAMLSLLIAATIACGDDDEADTGEPDQTSPAATREEDDSPTATDGADNTGAPTGQATGLDDEVQVQADDFRFNPETFSLPEGVLTKIEVTNVGAAPHTLTVYSDSEYNTEVPGADTGNIEAGEDASIETTFDSGEYFYRCEIHPTQMEGEFTAQ